MAYKDNDSERAQLIKYYKSVNNFSSPIEIHTFIKKL